MKKKKQIMKKFASLFLAFAMVLTLVQVSPVEGLAANTRVNVRLHFNNVFSWGEPAIQFWGGSNTVVSGLDDDTAVEIPGWGGAVGYSLDQNGDWYEIELDGDFEGFQFLDLDNPTNNTGGQGYVSTMQYCNGDAPTDLYLVYDASTSYKPVWYLDADCSVSIDTLIPVDANKVGNETSASVNGVSYDFTYYGNDVYEVAVPVSSGASIINVTFLGEDLGATKVDMTEEGEVILRIANGKLLDSVHSADKFQDSAAIVGDFSGVTFANGVEITNWDPADVDGDMEYIGGGLYKKTLTYDELAVDTAISYKVAFNDSWAYSIGDGAGNVEVVLPAGSTEYTVICNEITGDIFEASKTVSLIGTVRSDDKWDPANTDYDFVQVSDSKYMTQLTLDPGSYEFKVVYNHADWMGGDNRNITVTDNKKVVTFVYDLDADDVTASVKELTNDKVTYNVHFNNESSWETINAYLAEGDSWSAIGGYSYANAWPGAEIVADTANAGWYSFSVTKTVGSSINIILNNGNGAQTGNIILNDKTPVVEYWVSDNGSTIEKTKPADWVNSTCQAPINPNIGALESPVVNADRTITFNVSDKDFGADADVRVMGTVGGTDWSTGLAMDYDAANHNYTLTTGVQAPGVYQYKFRSGNTWICDPVNENMLDGNSKVVVAGLSNGSFDVKRGEEFELPETLALYDEDGTKTDAEVSYALETASDDIVLDGTTILVKEGTTVETVKLVATAGTETSIVTLAVKDQVFTYHIYFFGSVEAHRAVDAADLWAWEDKGANLGPVAFTEAVDIDGKTWIRADLVTSATNIGLIPRSAGCWEWQTGNHYYNNENKEEEVNLYIVEGDDTNTYTEVPEVKEARSRFVMVEYERENADYDGWNIYTWNSGFGSAVTVDSTVINGKTFFIIPVKDSDKDLLLSFCMRHSTEDNEWEQKDGNDHAILVPADQTVVKTKFVQGKGVVSHQEYNTGVKRNAAESKMTFYYRDDTFFLADKEEELGTVEVVINGSRKEMTYNAQAERYEYDLVDCANGEYAYYYLVNGESDRILDQFNSEKMSFEGQDASKVVYKKITDVTLSAELANATMTSRDNNVVTLSFEGASASDVERHVSSANIDLSSVGLKTLAIDPSLLEATISVNRTTKAGKKTLPITVVDVYGNIFTTTVSLTVKKAATNSFDWDEAVVYMTCTDRFFDGNTTNNDGVNKDGSLSRHGGDFAGLTQKLDYLKGLGVNTIWITPIVENKSNVTTTTADGTEIESTGFCGYWATDFTKLDSHLGTEEEFQNLLDEAHKRGMKLMVDVVLNHSGYTQEGVFDSDSFNQIIVNEETGEYIPMLRDASNTISGDDVYSSLAGLPDFATENEEVRDQLIEWQVNWMDRFDIDYYRVDTVKHVNAETWKAFKNELTKVNPEFKMIGEYAGEGYANTAGSLASGSMDSLLDFDFNDKALAFVSGDLTGVEGYMEERNASINNTATLGAFLSSHDENSLVDKIMETGVSEDEALNLFKVAATLQLTAKGQAVIYYGEEIGQHGLDNYPIQSNRYDFDWSEVERQSKDKNSMLNHYKTLLAIRNSHKELLANGTREAVDVNDALGYEVIKRSYNGKDLYLAMNVREAASTVTFTVNEAAGTTMKDLYSGKTYKVAKNKTVTITIPEAAKGGTVILEKQTTNIIDKIIEILPKPVQNIVAPIVNGIRNIIGGLFGNNQTTVEATPAATVAAPETADKDNKEVVEEKEEKDDSKDSTISDNESPKASNTDDATSNGFNPLVGILGGAVVVVLAGGISVFAVRRKRK